MSGTSGLPGPLQRLPRPVREFLQLEASGGVVLLLATLIALAWANSPFGDSYETWWHTELSIGLGDASITEDLRHWVNDGLMAIFFFVVGLEIKRELVKGELRDPRTAALPAIAALGGMVVPAALYLVFNVGGDGVKGWGIPMATDIAFAIGLISLFGSRISQSLKVFLLSLAIVDDIGAILVIAVFYTEELALGWLAGAAVLLATTAILRRRQVVSTVLYLVLGIGVWFFTFESGIHATIAGVALGLITPARPFDPQARSTEGEEDDIESSVTDRLLHHIHPYSSFLVIPVFALANAGIPLGAAVLSEAATSPIALGVFFGLVVGKVVGITLFSAVGVRLRLVTLPTDSKWSQVIGVSALGGVGFTVSLFITSLAFSGESAEIARVGVVVASVTAAALGCGILLAASPSPAKEETGADTYTP